MGYDASSALIPVGTVFFMLFIHWFADFRLQTDWQANNKSKDFKALLAHTSNYSWVWLAVCLVCTDIRFAFWFTSITFVLHTLTDYVTSRITSRLYAEKNYREFFQVIGIDQVLHYVQLITTWYLLVF